MSSVQVALRFLVLPSRQKWSQQFYLFNLFGGCCWGAAQLLGVLLGLVRLPATLLIGSFRLVREIEQKPQKQMKKTNKKKPSPALFVCSPFHEPLTGKRTERQFGTSLTRPPIKESCFRRLHKAQVHFWKSSFFLVFRKWSHNATLTVVCVRFPRRILQIKTVSMMYPMQVVEHLHKHCTMRAFHCRCK